MQPQATRMGQQRGLIRRRTATAAAAASAFPGIDGANPNEPAAAAAAAGYRHQHRDPEPATGQPRDGEDREAAARGGDPPRQPLPSPDHDDKKYRAPVPAAAGRGVPSLPLAPLLIGLARSPPSSPRRRRRRRRPSRVASPGSGLEGLPLHRACLEGASAEVLRGLLVPPPLGTASASASAAGDAVGTAEPAYGRLPLHLLCRSGGATVGAVRELLRSEESTTATAASAATATDVFGRLPLHYCLANGDGDGAAASLLLSAYPDGAAVADMEGWTPLHVAAGAGVPVRGRILADLVRAHPAAASMRTEGWGSTPLDCARRFAGAEYADGLARALPELLREEEEEEEERREGVGGGKVGLPAAAPEDPASGDPWRPSVGRRTGAPRSRFYHGPSVV